MAAAFDKPEITQEMHANARNSIKKPSEQRESARKALDDILDERLSALGETRTVDELARAARYLGNLAKRPEAGTLEGMAHQYLSIICKELGCNVPPLDTITIEEAYKTYTAMTFRNLYNQHSFERNDKTNRTARDAMVLYVERFSELEDTWMVEKLRNQMQSHTETAEAELRAWKNTLAATEPKTIVDSKAVTEKPVAGFARGRGDDDFGNRPVDRDPDPDPS